MEILINGTLFTMSERSWELTLEGARLAELEARAKEPAQSPATRNGSEIHAVCGEAARIRFALKHGKAV